VFVAEHAPAGRAGFAGGILTSALSLGILLGSVTAAVIATFPPEEILGGLWRVPFVLGGALGLLALWLRSYLNETPVFEALRARRELASGIPLRQVLAGYRSGIARSMAYTWMLTAGIVVVILMTPTLAQSSFDIGAREASFANMLATFCLAVGCGLFGASADRFGVSRTVLTGVTLMAASTLLLYWVLANKPDQFLVAYMFAGLCMGVAGVVPAAMVQAFPAPIRFSGVSFSYNLMYAIAGGFSPLIVVLWTRQQPQAAAYYVAAVAAIAAVTAVWSSTRAGETFAVTDERRAAVTVLPPS
jgi:MFS family permease